MSAKKNIKKTPQASNTEGVIAATVEQILPERTVDIGDYLKRDLPMFSPEVVEAWAPEVPTLDLIIAFSVTAKKLEKALGKPLGTVVAIKDLVKDVTLSASMSSKTRKQYSLTVEGQLIGEPAVWEVIEYNAQALFSAGIADLGTIEIGNGKKWPFSKPRKIRQESGLKSFGEELMVKLNLTPVPEGTEVTVHSTEDLGGVRIDVKTGEKLEVVPGISKEQVAPVVLADSPASDLEKEAEVLAKYENGPKLEAELASEEKAVTLDIASIQVKMEAGETLTQEEEAYLNA